MSKRSDDLAKRSRFRMDDLQVQPDRLRVLRGEEEIALEPRMMEVLVMLATHAGETISKERLLVEVWGSKVYGESPVNAIISKLRKQIRDNARTPRYIETVSKTGFKLIAPVDLPEDYRRLSYERWTDDNPYVGLSAFDGKHASVFCGRSRITANLLKAMRNQFENQRRFVLLVGASGCGKTSLLRAGAIPLLTKPDGFDGFHALSVACCDLAAVPAGDPLTPLIEALANWRVGDRTVFPPQTTEQLKSLLTEYPDSIGRFVAEAFSAHRNRELDSKPNAHLLLTIDHAEALATAASLDAGTVARFESILRALCGCCRVMVAMVTRGDFYLKLIEAVPSLAEHKSGDGHLDVTVPREGEIAEIIRTPAWKADLSFETDPGTRNRLDDVLRDAAIAQPDALPLLQHTLWQLYEDCDKRQRLLTFAAYRRIGGLEGAIAHRAEQVFADLPSEAQACLGAVLAQLIVPDSDAVRARKAYKDAISSEANVLVDAFIDGRLFIGDYNDGRPIFGVAHEALLRRWPRAVEWAEENQRVLLAKARLQRAAERWDKDSRKNDHLLNPGLPLAEAINVANSPTLTIDNTEKEFIAQSQRQKNRALRIRRSAMAALIGLTFTSMILTAVSIRSSRTAVSQKAQSADLASYIIGKVADEVDATGNLDLIESMGAKILRYCESIDVSDMSAQDMSSCAKASRKIGEVRMEESKQSEAEALFARAIVLAESAEKLSGKDPSIVMEAGRCHASMGKLKARQFDYSAALKEWELHLSKAESLIGIDGKKPEYIIEQSSALTNVGYAYREKGDFDKALFHLTKSVQKKNEAIAIRDNQEWRFDRIGSESMIAGIEASNGDLLVADSHYDRLIGELKELLGSNPNALEWERQLTSLLHFRSALAIDMGDLDNAQTLIDDASNRLRKLASTEKNNQNWKNLLAYALYTSAEIARHRSNTADALKNLKEAQALIPPKKDNYSAVAVQRALNLFRLRIAQGDITGEREANEPLKELEILANPKNTHGAFLAADALLVRSAAEKMRGRINESNADAQKAARYIAQASPRHGRIALTNLRTRAALLGESAKVSDDDISFLISSGYRHPDFLAALSIFCDTAISRTSQIHAACSVI